MLRNLLLAWAPFDQSDYRVVMRGDTAFAWAWDRVAAREQLEQAGAPADARLWPEPLLRERPLADGVNTLHALEGFEAQLWRGGELLASRWWSAVPDDDEWARWCRALPAGQPAGADCARPDQAMPGWCAPWATVQDLDGLTSARSRIERLTLLAGIAGLVGLSAAQAHLAWAAQVQRRELGAQAQRLAAVSAPLLATRKQALDLLGEAQALSQQLVALQPLEVLQHLAERLPPRGVQLKELELAGPRLRIALEATADVARATLVKDLQAAGWFQQVTEVRDSGGRGWLWFEMQVTGLQPPAAVPAALSTAPAVATRP